MREVPAPSPLLGRIEQYHSGGLGFGGCLSNSASYFVEKVKISVTPISYQRATAERFASHCWLGLINADNIAMSRVITSDILIVVFVFECTTVPEVANEMFGFGRARRSRAPPRIDATSQFSQRHATCVALQQFTAAPAGPLL